MKFSFVVIFSVLALLLLAGCVDRTDDAGNVTEPTPVVLPPVAELPEPTPVVDPAPIIAPEMNDTVNGSTMNGSTDGSMDGPATIDSTGSTASYRATTALDGLKEVPFVSTDASGEAVAVLDGSTLTVTGTCEGLGSQLTKAHVHLAPLDESGAVLFGLDVQAVGNNSCSFTGDYILDPGQVSAFINGQTYVNVHTTENPNGEIRGQFNPEQTGTSATVEANGSDSGTNWSDTGDRDSIDTTGSTY